MSKTESVKRKRKDTVVAAAAATESAPVAASPKPAATSSEISVKKKKHKSALIETAAQAPQPAAKATEPSAAKKETKETKDKKSKDTKSPTAASALSLSAPIIDGLPGVDIPSKKSSKDKKGKSKSKASAASVASASAASSPIASKTGFSTKVVSYKVVLPASRAGEPLNGVREQLNWMLAKYVPQLDSIVLSYSNIRFLEESGTMLNESPFVIFPIMVQLLTWMPQPGMVITGTINMQSSDHIGVLLYNTFNASIPAERIPRGTYKWVSSAERNAIADTLSTADDAGALEESEEAEHKEQTGDENANEGEFQAETSLGEWVLRDTEEALVSVNGGMITFTIVDVIKMNDLISVVGSLP